MTAKRKKRSSSQKAATAATEGRLPGFLLVVLLLLLFAFAATDFEVISFKIAPTPAKAYALAEKHFDAANSEEYDLDKAKAYYEHALALNPDMKYARHQLARIEFLRSRFPEAITLIDEEIARFGADASPSSFYIRGLIYGFMGEFEKAEADYKTYRLYDRSNWAAANDLAWVLLRAGRHEDALDVLNEVVPRWPENPWLLNSRAIAYYERSSFTYALQDALRARTLVESLTQEEWSQAYPGNDPLIAREGLAHFTGSVLNNIHRIEIALDAQRDIVP